MPNEQAIGFIIAALVVAAIIGICELVAWIEPFDFDGDDDKPIY